MAPGALRRLLGVATLIGVRVAGAVIAGGLAVYVARVHGAEFSGTFFVLVSTLTILSVLTRLGAEPYLTEQIARRESRGRSDASYLASTTWAVLAMLLAAGALLLALEIIAPDVSERLLGGLDLPLLLCAVLGLNLLWLTTAYCRAKGAAGLSIFLETSVWSIWLWAVLLVSELAGDTPDTTAVAVGVALMVPTFLLLLAPTFARSRENPLRPRGFREAIGGVTGFGAMTVTNGIFALIPLQVLGWYGMTEEAGVYNAALRVSMVIGASGVIIKSIVVRQAVHGQGLDPDARRAHVRHTGWLALPWLAVSLLIAWQGDLLSALFGSGFGQIESIVLIILVAQSINVACFYLETRAVLAGQRRLLNLTSATVLVLSLGLSPVLVAQYGLTGAAWAFAIPIVTSRLQLAWLYLRSPVAPAAGVVAGGPEEHRLESEELT